MKKTLINQQISEADNINKQNPPLTSPLTDIHQQKDVQPARIPIGIYWSIPTLKMVKQGAIGTCQQLGMIGNPLINH